MESPYKKVFKDEKEKEEYKAKLQKLIDEKAQEIKHAPDSMKQEELIREVLMLYKVKEANYGLGLTNRLGLNIIRKQLETLSKANRLYHQGLSKDYVEGITNNKV